VYLSAEIVLSCRRSPSAQKSELVLAGSIRNITHWLPAVKWAKSFVTKSLRSFYHVLSPEQRAQRRKAKHFCLKKVTHCNDFSRALPFGLPAGIFQYMIKLTKKCMITGMSGTLELPITLEQYQTGMLARKNGALIQKAFPMLDADQREFILTGILPATWEAAFGEPQQGYITQGEGN
jgi:hypothetical protein